MHHLRLRSLRAILAAAALVVTGACSYVRGGPLISDPNGPIGTIVLNNQSGYTLTSVLLSKCSSSTYGLNRLPKDTRVANRTTYQFRVQAGCWSIAAGLPAARGTMEVRGRVEVAPNGTSTFTVGAPNR